MAITTILAYLNPRAAHLPQGHLSRLLPFAAGGDRRWMLGFDDTANQSVTWVIPQVPDCLTGGTLKLDVLGSMASATSGDIDVDVEVEAITPADAVNLSAASSFDTVNSTDNTVVPATADRLFTVTVTLTNDDSVVAGDMLRIKVTRDAAADTATGDWRLIGATLYEEQVISEVVVRTGNGHGSTNDAIRRFTTAEVETGSDITYADSAASGGTFTINADGLYHMVYIDRKTDGGTTFGVSLNSDELTTAIESITITDVMVLVNSVSTAQFQNCSCTLSLSATDVIRAHTNKGPEETSGFVKFRIIRVA